VMPTVALNRCDVCQSSWPNFAFNRTRRYVTSTWRTSVAGGAG